MKYGASTHIHSSLRVSLLPKTLARGIREGDSTWKSFRGLSLLSDPVDSPPGCPKPIFPSVILARIVTEELLVRVAAEGGGRKPGGSLVSECWYSPMASTIASALPSSRPSRFLQHGTPRIKCAQHRCNNLISAQLQQPHSTGTEGKTLPPTSTASRTGRARS